MTTPAKATRPSVPKRYGPLIGIVVVILLVGGGILAFRGGGSRGRNTDNIGTTPSAIGLPLTFNRAKKEGTASSINWGPNCNTTLGQVKIPSVDAPSCVEPYDTSKGNGGATADGVTTDSINLVYYIADPNPDAQFRTAQGFAGIYQKHFELWGRTVNLIKFIGSGSSTDATAAKADAVKIASDDTPFAVIGGPSQTTAFRDELAARNIICLGGCAGAVSQAQSDDIGKGLLFWPDGPSPEQASELTAAMICSQFKTGTAVYGGGGVQKTKRVFGIAHSDTPTGDQVETYQALTDSLSNCGITAKAEVSFLDPAKSQGAARTVVARLKGAGVTSVIYLGDPISPISITKEATALEWFPEWIIGPTMSLDTTAFGRQLDQKQWAHAFGIGLPATPSVQKSGESYNLYEWGLGVAPPSAFSSSINANVGLAFRAFQLAGPNLTPESVEGGLYAEPIRGGGPTTPRVSRGEHGLWPAIDNYGSDDATLIWWNPSITGVDEVGNRGTGMYEHAANGTRYTLKGWPTSKVKLFDPSNSVTVFETLPPTDQPPTYPSPAS